MSTDLKKKATELYILQAYLSLYYTQQIDLFQYPTLTNFHFINSTTFFEIIPLYLQALKWIWIWN